MLTLTFHSDPGHGWLEVPKRLIPYSVGKTISAYSYTDNNNFYLEEDCDAKKGIDHLKSLGDEIKIVQKHTDNDSFIRNLKHIC